MKIEVKDKLENAIIKVGGIEAGKTDKDGELTLPQLYKAGTKLSLEVTLASYKTFTKEIEVQNNDGKEYVVSVELTKEATGMYIYSYLYLLWSCLKKFYFSCYVQNFEQMFSSYHQEVRYETSPT